MPITRRKEVLTTGEVARICHVAPRTVTKWFDTGKLRGYRIPGSGDRRIPVQQLVAFMRAHDIPLGALDGGLARVLIFDPAAPPELIDGINARGRHEARTAAGDFEAGVEALQFRPHVIVLDADDRRRAEALCRKIKANEELQTVKVIAAASDLTPGRSETLMQRGFDACLSKPLSSAQLVAAVERLTDLMA